jgi:sterol desaturase/sphingolipid hydroxylase (fatty acid hydroxylase superfamily)
LSLTDLAFLALLMGAQILLQAAALLGVRLVGERFWPAGPPRPQGDNCNLQAWILGHLAHFALSPALGVVVTLLVNRAGGGLIPLPSHGWGLVVGVAVYFVVMDFGEYVFHLAQHRLPWLWAWHSLHHSDTTFDSSTTVRHFWLDPILKTVTIYLAAGLLLKAPMSIGLIYSVLTLYNFVAHSNTRLDFGRWSWLLNSPAYHRLHHSASAEHFDVNFAGMLPIFDVLAGAYRPARPGERPATGLDTGERPTTAGEVALWPVRARLGLKPTHDPIR